MFMFTCERCNKEFPLPKIYDGWKVGDQMLCQKCWDELKSKETTK